MAPEVVTGESHVTFEEAIQLETLPPVLLRVTVWSVGLGPLAVPAKLSVVGKADKIGAVGIGIVQVHPEQKGAVHEGPNASQDPAREWHARVGGACVTPVQPQYRSF